jgi:hypothetical protein
MFKGFENFPYVAVVYANQDPPGHAQQGWWWSADVRSSTLGAFAACLYRHVQVSSVLETLLDHPAELMKYKVVYLADIPHLTEHRIENLKRFVERGGGLLVSYSSSLYGSDGQRKDRFGLEELVKVRPVTLSGHLKELIRSYTAMVGGPNDLYLLSNSEGGEHFAGFKERLVPLWFYEPVSVLDGGKAIADIVTGDDRRPILPGIVVSQYGAGKVAYLCSSLESLYLGSNIKELADLIQTLVQWVTPQPAPFELEGPDALVANMTFKENTRVLHLTNWTGNKFERRWVNEYYLAPVSDVSLRILVPEGTSVEKVHSLVKDSQVDSVVRSGFVDIQIPRIDAYQAVAVTFTTEPKTVSVLPE